MVIFGWMNRGMAGIDHATMVEIAAQLFFLVSFGDNLDSDVFKFGERLGIFRERLKMGF